MDEVQKGRAVIEIGRKVNVTGFTTTTAAEKKAANGQVGQSYKITEIEVL